jgi:hypothetical protein
LVVVGVFGAPDDHYYGLTNYSACTVSVPELNAFVSTHIDFLSPLHGSQHAVGVPIDVNVAVAIFPSLPRELMERLLLCLQVLHLE